MIGFPPNKRSFIVISLTLLLVSSWWLKELVANTFCDHVCLVVAPHYGRKIRHGWNFVDLLELHRIIGCTLFFLGFLLWSFVLFSAFNLCGYGGFGMHLQDNSVVLEEVELKGMIVVFENSGDFDCCIASTVLDFPN
ncbi:hypothetical protein PIB30_103684 [Stylosanthes scabra]|uniref:Transmembrane protein n=1 Tax=Stylosanthes scabra TaxID=79078 RepID=A0ABU6V0S9_9FABA|nr:hypothetical protein [Stylosanthes scabra]